MFKELSKFLPFSSHTCHQHKLHPMDRINSPNIFSLRWKENVQDLILFLTTCSYRFSGIDLNSLMMISRKLKWMLDANFNVNQLIVFVFVSPSDGFSWNLNKIGIKPYLELNMLSTSCLVMFDDFFEVRLEGYEMF